ncbi:HTH-type transcriptional repressor CytR [compost metagenome]
MLGIEEVARKKGYHVLICNSLQDEKLEEAYLTNLFEKQINGLIISSISGSQKLLSSLIELGLLVIAIDQKIDLPEVQQIEFDFYRGGFMAANYLIEQGHRRIGYVSAPLNRPSRKRIYEGFLEALRQAGIDDRNEFVRIAKDEREIYEGIYEFENGKTLVRDIMSKRITPTAIFACNDLTAFGVIHELQSRGLKIPDDISVVGFDNIDFAQMITPALTTIKQPNYEMGKLACTLLLDNLNGDQNDVGDVFLQPKLIMRDSVARAKS